MAGRFAGILIIAILYFLLDGLGRAVALPLPTAILGIVVLAAVLLWLGRVPEFLGNGADTLIRLFPLLFIPPLVAVSGLGALLVSHWLVLLIAISLSTFAGLAATAFIYQAFRKGQGQ
ncbi:MAG: CidA/LrgA family protein [Alphaproteobacteria bacterium]|nr:CidA/LrgA family protein [Alphaproteobacteria bacterium]